MTCNSIRAVAARSIIIFFFAAMDFDLNLSFLPSSQDLELNDDDLQAMEITAVPENTKFSTHYGIKKFEEWLDKRSKHVDYKTIKPPELNDTLRKFYAEVRQNKQGKLLSPGTLTCLRAAIHRTLVSAPYSRDFNIIKDSAFTTANKMFGTRCKLYTLQGNPKPKHKPCIGEGDMTKLGQYFRDWNKSPQVLIDAVWFSLCFFFGRRGREGWTGMTKSTFSFDVDSEGHEYIKMKDTEATKNYQGGTKQKEQDYTDQRICMAQE